MILKLINEFKSATDDGKRVAIARSLIQYLEGIPLLVFFSYQSNPIVSVRVMVHGQIIELLQEFNIKLDTSNVFNRIGSAVKATIYSFDEEEDFVIREVMEEDSLELNAIKYAKLLESIGVVVKRVHVSAPNYQQEV